MQLISDIY